MGEVIVIFLVLIDVEYLNLVLSQSLPEDFGMETHIFSTPSHCHWMAPQGRLLPSSLLFSGALGAHFQIKLGSLLCFCLYPSAQKEWMGHCWEGKSLTKGMIYLRTLAVFTPLIWV